MNLWQPALIFQLNGSSKWWIWHRSSRCRNCCYCWPHWSGWGGSSSSWFRPRRRRRCDWPVPPRSAWHPCRGSWTETGARVRWETCRGDSEWPGSKPIQKQFIELRLSVQLLQHMQSSEFLNWIRRLLHRSRLKLIHLQPPPPPLLNFQPANTQLMTRDEEHHTQLWRFREQSSRRKVIWISGTCALRSYSCSVYTTSEWSSGFIRAVTAVWSAPTQSAVSGNVLEGHNEISCLLGGNSMFGLFCVSPLFVLQQVVSERDIGFNWLWWGLTLSSDLIVAVEQWQRHSHLGAKCLTGLFCHKWVYFVQRKEMFKTAFISTFRILQGSSRGIELQCRLCGFHFQLTLKGIKKYVFIRQLTAWCLSGVNLSEFHIYIRFNQLVDAE